jgi:uncharacterized membrane protein
MSLGRRVYGVGVMALGVVCLVWRDLVLGQTLPNGLPGRVALAWIAGGLLLIAGAAMEWRRLAAWGATTVGALAGLMILVCGAAVARQYGVLGSYFVVAEQLTIAAGGLIVYGTGAGMDSRLRLRLTRSARMTFGVCAIFFGTAHFVYMNATAPLIPKWLPPGQVFWGCATGVCFVVAGIGLLTGVKARLAAILLTVMLGCFTLMVHVPMLVREHSGVFNWSELALNVTILGVAWLVADSLGRGKDV